MQDYVVDHRLAKDSVVLRFEVFAEITELFFQRGGFYVDMEIAADEFHRACITCDVFTGDFRPQSDYIFATGLRVGSRAAQHIFDYGGEWSRICSFHIVIGVKLPFSTCQSL